MSQQPQGPGWWQASDGKWYPPEQAPGYQAPSWPDPASSLQMHLDVMVDDMAAARPRVVELGARLLQADTYADPAGHPFCLIRRPSLAPPVGPA